MVAFCSMFDQQMALLAMARLLKRMNPKIITVIGGCSCDNPAGNELYRYAESIDYVFSGPSKIPGVISPETFSESYKNVSMDALDPVDEDMKITALDYQSFFSSLNRNLPDIDIQPILFFETSRGCPWAQSKSKRCSFCDVNKNNKKYTVMKAETAIEMFHNLFRYKNQCHLFWATDSMIPLSYLDTVFPHIKSLTKDTKIFYEIRTTATGEQLRKMADNNIRYVQAGIETLSDAVLKNFNKGTTCFDNLIFLKNCIEYNICVLWNILTGSPGETPEDYTDQFALIPQIVHLPPPSGVWAVSYQRNTEYFLNQKEYNIRLVPVTKTLKHIYPFPESALENMVYSFKNERNSEIFTLEYIRAIEKIALLISRWKKSGIYKRETHRNL